MAIRKIIKEGDPTLKKVSRPVDTVNRRVRILLDDLIDTVMEAEGAGLAAPQIGVLKRVAVVVDYSGEEPSVIELINPEIISTEGDQECVEGCLSCPGQYGLTNRPKKVAIKSLDRDGNEVIYEGEDMVAQAFCHETDHLDGVLFFDHVTRMLTDEELLARAAEKEKGQSAEADGG